MGLDLSAEGCPIRPQWAYSGFMRFREELAAEVGIPNLRAMAGFGGNVEWSTVTSPIEPLLNHSDCEGEMTWQECAQVGPELRRIVSSWPDTPFDHDRESVLMLADVMDHCAIVQVPLEFH